MSKILGLDLGNNSIGWAIVDTATNELIGRGVKIFPGAIPQHPHKRRRFLRAVRRCNQRFAARFLYIFRNYSDELFCQPAFINKIKKAFPVFIHSLLALLLAGSLIMAFTTKEFQFWFNLAITVLLGWIALKKA